MGEQIHRRKDGIMSTLVAIGYPDETTGTAAAEEARRLADDLAIQPEAIAVVSRDARGVFQVSTYHHAVGADTSWGMSWGLLFGLVFFIPVFGMTAGAGLRGLLDKVAETGVDGRFQEQARELLRPGTSAVFFVADRVSPETAVEGLSRYGGTVLRTALSKDREKQLQDVLHGSGTVANSPDRSRANAP